MTEETDNPFRVPVTSNEKPGTSPLGVVLKDPEPQDMPKILEFAATELGFAHAAHDPELMDRLALAGEKWEWEDYQIRYLETEGWYIANKARQTGLSAVFGMGAETRGILSQGNYTGIFVSYKKEEAINKVNYVKAFLECLPIAFRKEIIRDPLQLIEWRNRNGTISKIISHAQKPVRGHHGDVWLDEFGFFQNDRLIYESCLPVTAQVGGSIHIASTPFGKAGMFYEIHTDRIRYPEFYREWIYWWWCKRYLREPTDEFMFDAMQNAWKLSPEERVYKYGNSKIITQFRSLDLETFQQEFEGLFVDEQAFFFSRALIMNSMFEAASTYDDYHPQREDFTIPIEEALAHDQFRIEKLYPDVDFKKYDSLDELTNAVRCGKVSPNLFGGIDIGATRHSTDLRILEEIHIPESKRLPGQAPTLHVERFSLNKRGWDLDDQQAYFTDLFRRRIIRKCIIDGGGIGFQMAENLKKNFRGVVQVIRMNSVATERNELMNNLRRRMSGNGLALAYDRQTIEDLHSIKSVITSNKTQRFVTEEKRRHHGDGAWSISFACMAGTPFGVAPNGLPVTTTSFSLPGYDSDSPTLRRWEDIEDQKENIQAKKYADTLKSNQQSRKGTGYLGRIMSGKEPPSFSPGPYIHDWDK